MGAIAFRIHCPQFVSLLDAMDRPVTDLDFAGYKKQRLDIVKLFQGLGYTTDKIVMFLGERLRFLGNSNPNVDIFLDRLEMCHTIDFRDRLENGSPTISLADLLLEKMQIVQTNEKDFKDTIVLLRNTR